MNIGRDNYESYFMDYLDGNLNSGQVEILLSFLEFNPDLKKELEGLGNVALEPLDHVFKDKAGLRKPTETPVLQDLRENFEDYCILSIEKQLSPQEETMLQTIIKDEPEKQNIYRLYCSTTLQPDEGILFPGKSRLKKRYIDIPRVRITMSSAAAVAVILLALTWFFRNETLQNEISESESEPILIEEKVPEYNITSNPETKITVQDKEATDIARKIGSKSRIPEPGPKTFFPDPILLARIEPIKPQNLRNPVGEPELSMRYQPKKEKFDDYLKLQEYALLQAGKSFSRDRAEGRFSFWKLADSGIQKISQVSEGDFSFEREMDESGKINRLTFETSSFGISAPMRNSNIPR
ncbi:hypothetical protein ACFLR8_00275 [Bacteroidota bacterium]